MRRAKVLLLDECANPQSDIARRLAHWDADCRFAKSYAEVREFLTQQTFQLVISARILMDGSVRRVIPLLEGSQTTLFCSYPVEDSCLWMRVLDRGQVCWGMPALRPSEFGRVLRQVVKGEGAPPAKTQR